MTMPAAAPIDLPMRRERALDPPAELAALRAERPVCRLRYRDGRVGWLVTSHRLARAVMTDRRFLLTAQRPFPTQDPAKHAAIIETPARIGADGGDLLQLDPPDHTRLRRAILSRFTREQTDALRPRVTEIVRARLDAMERLGPPVDLVETFAAPIALGTHCALLGLPEENGRHIERFSRAAADPDAHPDAVADAILALGDHLRHVVAQKREAPGDDLISHLVGRDELTENEVLGILVLMYNAGVDTVAHMLAAGPFAMLCNPEQLALLRDSPELIDGAVEELMRYLTIFQVGALTRTAGEDVELAGQTIRAGESVTVSLAAANRDPERFAAPDRLDVRRNARGQLGFGHGIHVCLGQHLARVEMKAGIGELLRRFPTLALDVAVDDVPLTTERHLIFGVRELPVRW
jgi:cytochrome P450